MSRKEEQGGFIVEVPDDVAPGRPVNYINVNVNNGNVVMDLGFIGPVRQGQEKPEAILVFRGGTHVAYIRVMNRILTELLRQIDAQPPGDPGATPPPAAGGAQIN